MSKIRCNEIAGGSPKRDLNGSPIDHYDCRGEQNSNAMDT